MVFLKNKYIYSFKLLLMHKKLVHITKFNISNINLFFMPIDFIIIRYNFLFFINDIFKILISNLKKNMLLLFCNFLYSKIFLKVGLGFRKKYSKNMNCYVINIGRRYWVVIKALPSCYFFNIKRRSIFLFSSSKSKMYLKLNKLRILRKETVYKYKGIMSLNRIIFEIKVSRSILFARRVKFKNISLKLTKKQKQKK